MTITDAAKEVLKSAGQPLTADEIYNRICEQSLFTFGAVAPKGVLRSKIRRHCLGLNFATAHPVKFFRLVGGDQYALESWDGVKGEQATPPASENSQLPEEAMQTAHRNHLSELRQQLKAQMVQMHPAAFEKLVIDLLIKMGFGGSDPQIRDSHGASG